MQTYFQLYPIRQFIQLKNKYILLFESYLFFVRKRKVQAIMLSKYQLYSSTDNTFNIHHKKLFLSFFVQPLPFLFFGSHTVTVFFPCVKTSSRITAIYRHAHHCHFRQIPCIGRLKTT